MNTIHKRFASSGISLIWIVAITAPQMAVAEVGRKETGRTEDAQLLLEEAKTNELERKISAKQTELERYNEDLNRAREQADALEKSIDKVGVAVGETNAHLDQLASQKRRLTQMLELVTMRIEAEKTKADGLRMLGAAQTKALGAIARRNEETELKTNIAKADLAVLSPKELPIIGAADGPESGPGKHTSATEMRKRLEKVNHTTIAAGTAAREAMVAATAKLQQADAAGAKAARRGSELGIDEIPELPGEKESLDLSATLPAAMPGADSLPTKKGTAEKKRAKR